MSAFSLSVDNVLAAPSDEEARQFYAELMRLTQASVTGSDTAEGFEVRLDVGGGKGKGLVATRFFAENAEVLREHPLVSVQGIENRNHVLACSNCFRIVGSVELQLACRLIALLEHDPSELSPEARAEAPGIVRALLAGQLRLPYPHICALPTAILCPGGCSDVYCCSRCCAEAWQKHHCLLCPGQPTSPCSAQLRQFARDSPYCKRLDLATLAKFEHDRDRFGWLMDLHRVPGRNRVAALAAQWPPAAAAAAEAHDPAPHAANDSDMASAVSGYCASDPAEALSHLTISMEDEGSQGSKDRCKGVGAEEYCVVNGLAKPPWVTTSASADAVCQLVGYARDMEMDTILLLAQLVAQLICSVQHCAWLLKHGSVGCAPLGASGEAAFAHAQRLLGTSGEAGDAAVLGACFLAVWQPLKMALKRPLWDCVTPPAGLTRHQYRTHLEVLVENCTRLCRGCMHDARFEALFAPQFAAHVLGMFELNSLGITVENPVEDLQDELQARRKTDGGLAVDAALTASFLQTEKIYAMLGGVDVPCEGAAFYTLQSCLNHDSAPNCSCQKDVDDRDGCASLTTVRSIQPGEELTISYVGDVGQMDPEVAKASLAEYGIPS